MSPHTSSAIKNPILHKSFSKDCNYVILLHMFNSKPIELIFLFSLRYLFCVIDGTINPLLHL